MNSYHGIRLRHEIRKYKERLDNALGKVHVENYPVFCCFNQECNNDSHKANIEDIYSLLINILNNASNQLKKTKPCKGRQIPGWNIYVKNSYNDARLHFFAWLNAGKPKVGLLTDNMKASRNKFRVSLKKCKAKENKIRNNNLINALQNKNTKEFWKYVRRYKNNDSSLKSKKIENENDSHKIATLFSNKFKLIFDDKKCQTESSCLTNNESNKKHKMNLRYFTTEIIIKAIKMLNPGIGPDNIHSNHLLLATNDFYSFLSNFFSMCFRHRYLPRDLLKGVILPLVKDQFGDKENIDNYRPIMASRVFLKTLEYCIKTIGLKAY